MIENDANVVSIPVEEAGGGNGKTTEDRLCTKFFSIHGCAYGDDCHFLHTYRAGLTLPSRPAPLPYVYAVNAHGMHMNEKVKTRLCRHFQSPEGCRYGERCFFAHGEAELRTEEFNIATGIGMPGCGTGSAFEQCVLVPVPQAHVGTVVGKAGSNIAITSSESGAKVSMLSADYTNSDGSRLCRVVGTPLDVQKAKDMIEHRLVIARRKKRDDGKSLRDDKSSMKPYKTKICVSWINNGSCTFGDNCHFAHGEVQLQKRFGNDENVESIVL